MNNGEAEGCEDKAERRGIIEGMQRRGRRDDVETVGRAGAVVERWKGK